LGGYGIEARLGAPRGIRRLFRRQRFLERLLDRVEDARRLRRQIASEVVQESLLRRLAPIVVEDNAACGRGRRIILRQRRIVLARIGGGDFGSPPTSVTIIPEKEWPTSTVGPGYAAIARRAASDASCSEVRGFY